MIYNQTEQRLSLCGNFTRSPQATGMKLFKEVQFTFLCNKESGSCTRSFGLIADL